MVHTPDYSRQCLFSLQHGLAASVGIVQDKAGRYVVDNRWVASGAALCVEWRKLSQNISILAFQLMFHIITIEHSCFKKNPHVHTPKH